LTQITEENRFVVSHDACACVHAGACVTQCAHVRVQLHKHVQHSADVSTQSISECLPGGAPVCLSKCACSQKPAPQISPTIMPQLISVACTLSSHSSTTQTVDLQHVCSIKLSCHKHSRNRGVSNISYLSMQQGQTKECLEHAMKLAVDALLTGLLMRGNQDGRLQNSCLVRLRILLCNLRANGFKFMSTSLIHLPATIGCGGSFCASWLLLFKGMASTFSRHPNCSRIHQM
jgi:hypothetical protein